MQNSKTKYYQFSKKIVVAVTICVTLICLIAIVLCWDGHDLDALTGVVKVYIQYAMIVFVAYSGNSAIEKWVISRGPRLQILDKEEPSEQDNG